MYGTADSSILKVYFLCVSGICVLFCDSLGGVSVACPRGGRAWEHAHSNWDLRQKKKKLVLKNLGRIPGFPRPLVNYMYLYPIIFLPTWI